MWERKEKRREEGVGKGEDAQIKKKKLIPEGLWWKKIDEILCESRLGVGDRSNVW